MSVLSCFSLDRCTTSRSRKAKGIGGTAHLVMVTTVDAERPGTAPITKLSHLVVLGTPISGIEKIFMSLDARIARAGRLHGWEQRTSW